MPPRGHIFAEVEIELDVDNLVNLRIPWCERIIGADGPGAIATILRGIFQGVVLKFRRVFRICELIVKALVPHPAIAASFDRRIFAEIADRIIAG